MSNSTSKLLKEKVELENSVKKLQISLQDEIKKLNPVDVSTKTLKNFDPSKIIETINKIDRKNISIDKSIYKTINDNSKTLTQLRDDVSKDTIANKVAVKLPQYIEEFIAKSDSLLELNNKIYKTDSLFKIQISSLKDYLSIKLFKDSLNTLNEILKLESDYEASNLEKFKFLITRDSLLRSGFQNKIIESSQALVEKGDFLIAYFTDLLKKFSNSEHFSIKIDQTKEFELKNKALYTDSLSKIYVVLKDLIQKDNISLKDVKYIDNQVIPFFINYAILYSGSNNLVDRVNEFKLLSNLLKIKAVSDVKLDDFDSLYLKVFGFIANLGNLDQAKTYQQMLDLFQQSNSKVEESLKEGQFKETYMLFSNSIKKYTIVNTNQQYVNIDVASFLTEMQQYYQRHNKSIFDLYLTLGLNQSILLNNIKYSNQDSSDKIGFASEKLGLRIRLKSFQKVRGYENVIKSDINLNKRSPFVNDWYAAIYGSGLLYSIANTTSDSKFDFPQMGITTGLRFYNALDVNLFYAVPFISGKNLFSNGLIGIGFDIPLGEYLEKIGKKNR